MNSTMQMMPQQRGSVQNQMIQQRYCNQANPQMLGQESNQMVPQHSNRVSDQVMPQYPAVVPNKRMQQEPGVAMNQTKPQDQGVFLSTPIVINNAANSNQSSVVNNNMLSGRDCVYVKTIGSQTWAWCCIISIITCCFTGCPCGVFAFLCPCDETAVYPRGGRVYSNDTRAGMGNAANMNVQNGSRTEKKNPN